MPNLNVTYAEMQSAASQLKAGEQQIEGDLTRLKSLVDNLVASGYVTDSSSKQFEASYAEFSVGATKLIQGLTGMGQYSGYCGERIPGCGHPARRFAQVAHRSRVGRFRAGSVASGSPGCQYRAPH